MSPERRVLGIAAASLAICAVLAVQLVRLQLIDPRLGPGLASGAYVRVVEVEPPRGLIVDRAGRVIARNVARYELTVVPADLPGEEAARDATLRTVARVAGVPLDGIRAHLAGGIAVVDPLVPVVLRGGLAREEAIRLRAALAGLPALSVRATAERRYGGGELFAHVLGYVGALPDGDADAYVARGYRLDSSVGLSGLEARYEDALRGTAARRLVLSSASGREVATLGEEPAAAGATVVLSLDQDLQEVAAQALDAGIAAGLAALPAGATQGGRPPIAAGAAVLIDVRSGELLALVSRPSFDANLLTPAGDEDALTALFADPAQPLVDRSYMEARSPGSTFKPLVALAALEEGIATPSTRITSTGAIYVRDQYDPSVVYTFRDWTAHGSLDMYGGIARSSDVYFYYLAGGYAEGGRQIFEGLGPDRISAYARAGGLGAPTGVDLPGESPGILPGPEWKERTVGDPWYLGDTYTYGIGQGYLSTTPLQMAVLTAALANGGDVLRPRVVRALLGGDGERSMTPEVAGRLPASDESLEVVREAMRVAASEGGTARTGRPEGLVIGGKTGTAEFGERLAGGEFPTHGWYVGFAPYEQPEVAIAVFLHHGGGSQHAGPVARAILEAYEAWRDPRAGPLVLR